MLHMLGDEHLDELQALAERLQQPELVNLVNAYRYLAERCQGNAAPMHIEYRSSSRWVQLLADGEQVAYAPYGVGISPVAWLGLLAKLGAEVSEPAGDWDWRHNWVPE